MPNSHHSPLNLEALSMKEKFSAQMKMWHSPMRLMLQHCLNEEFRVGLA